MSLGWWIVDTISCFAIACSLAYAVVADRRDRERAADREQIRRACERIQTQ